MAACFFFFFFFFFFLFFLSLCTSLAASAAHPPARRHSSLFSRRLAISLYLSLLLFVCRPVHDSAPVPPLAGGQSEWIGHCPSSGFLLSLILLFSLSSSAPLVLFIRFHFISCPVPVPFSLRAPRPAASGFYTSPPSFAHIPLSAGRAHSADIFLLLFSPPRRAARCRPARRPAAVTVQISSRRGWLLPPPRFLSIAIRPPQISHDHDSRSINCNFAYTKLCQK